MSEQELRELDAWIAERVMGWHVSMSGSDPYEDGECWFNSEGKFPCIVPRYTTNPADAFEVLEKCAEKLGFLPDIKKARAGYAWIFDHSTGEAPTLPLAICLFAKQLFTNNPETKNV